MAAGTKIPPRGVSIYFQAAANLPVALQAQGWKETEAAFLLSNCRNAVCVEQEQGDPRNTRIQLAPALCCVYSIKNHSSQHRQGADWEYLTFKPQQPELETVIQHEDLRGCFQQTHSWLHSQFHTQPCKSCQTAALESQPCTPCSTGMGAHSTSGDRPVLPPQPPPAAQSHTGGEGTDLKAAGEASPHFPVPLLPQCPARVCYVLGIPLHYWKSRNHFSEVRIETLQPCSELLLNTSPNPSPLTLPDPHSTRGHTQLSQKLPPAFPGPSAKEILDLRVLLVAFLKKK